MVSIERVRWVVKLGGSLETSPHLTNWLAALCELPVVVVPGGGAAVDAVRRSQVRRGESDEVAHFRAIAAMEKNADSYRVRHPAFAILRDWPDLSRSIGPWMWYPLSMMRNDQRLPRDWRTTSDSLAAWLAQQLRTQLVLIKRCAPPADSHFATWAAQGVVDAHFPQIAAGLTVHLYQDHQWPQFCEKAGRSV